MLLLITLMMAGCLAIGIRSQQSSSITIRLGDVAYYVHQVPEVWLIDLQRPPYASRIPYALSRLPSLLGQASLPYLAPFSPLIEAKSRRTYSIEVLRGSANPTMFGQLTFLKMWYYSQTRIWVPYQKKPGQFFGHSILLRYTFDQTQNTLSMKDHTSCTLVDCIRHIVFIRTSQGHSSFPRFLQKIHSGQCIFCARNVLDMTNFKDE